MVLLNYRLILSLHSIYSVFKDFSEQWLYWNLDDTAQFVIWNQIYHIAFGNQRPLTSLNVSVTPNFYYPLSPLSGLHILYLWKSDLSYYNLKSSKSWFAKTNFYLNNIIKEHQHQRTIFTNFSQLVMLRLCKNTSVH